jgi:hypothetical protein
MALWKTKPTATALAPERPHLDPGLGLRLAAQLGDVVTSLGCMTAQTAMLAQEINGRLAAGEIADEQAAEIVNRLNNAHQDVESACRLVGRVRESLGPPSAQEVHVHA